MKARRGFTMVEAIISTLVVATMLTASLSAVGASRMSRARAADRVRGEQLALDMMAEILQLPYQDPVQTPVFGLEPGESSTSRAAWNDVDDYNGWTESPPQTKSGTVIPDFTGWTRTVLVEWIDPTTLTATTAANTGIKRITVTASRGSLVMAKVQGFRTLGWADILPTPTDATSNHPPVASAAIQGGSTSGNHPFSVNFNGTGSSDPDGDPLSYVWNFGDGSSAAGATPTHKYLNAGTFNATLTVYDGRGGVGIGTITITAY